MKAILCIGYVKLLLPEKANVDALVKTLAKAEFVEWSHRNGKDIYIPKERDKEIEIKFIRDDQYVDTSKVKRLPEKAGPDAHNTFGSKPV